MLKTTGKNAIKTMTKDEIEDLGVRYNTVVYFKAIMEFMCKVCRAKCDKRKKLDCIDYALKAARENSNLKDRVNGRSNKKY
jgi:hypothetical protein